MQIIQYLSWVLLLLGSFFCVIGAIGIYRFPDFYTRMHASGITDTMGAGAMLVGLALHELTLPHGSYLNVGRLLLIILFIFITSPTATHALAKSAYRRGPKPLLAKKEKDHNRLH